MSQAATISGSVGLFIGFEGIDGTGKSTQIEMLAKMLAGLGFEVVQTREPTDGVFGQRIRELYDNRGTVTREEELELFLDDRRQHIEELIAPALAAGKIVLTDRYYFSTIAYQGSVGLDPDEIRKRNEVFAPCPDLAFFLVLSPSVSAQRILNLRGQDLNAFEQVDSLVKVAALFDQMQDECIRRVDAELPIDVVHGRIVTEVKELLFRRGMLSRQK